MRSLNRIPLRQVYALLAGMVVIRVTASVVANYRRYLPPDFSSDFLYGRERDFLGSYPWPFYVHIVSGPVVLLLGLILVSTGVRLRFRRWHRALGRLQVYLVLLLVTPSGLWMAFYAEAGGFAGAGLASLAILTAVCTTLGARAASLRRFGEHRDWMLRSYLLLCSAVIIRLIGGLSLVLELTAWWIAPAAPWISWIIPLACFEVWKRLEEQRRFLPANPLVAAAGSETRAERLA